MSESTHQPAIMSTCVRRLDPSERDWANARYSEIDFLPSPASDLIAIADVGGEPAGLGRVTPLHDSRGELGGMYVFPAHRGAGVSRQLIRYLMRESGLDVLYCLPFEHLQALYAAEGFQACEPDDQVPPKVREKHAWCNSHYADPVCLMRWQQADHQDV